MAPSWHQNRTHFAVNENGMNLCDIDLSSHMATAQIILNQYFVAFDHGCTILAEFKDMMAHQSTLAAEGADEHDQYWELIWANLGCGLTMITGACTAINPIDFTIWSSIVLVFGMMIGISISSLCRFFTSSRKDHDCRCCQAVGIRAYAASAFGYYKALEMEEESPGCPRRLQIKRVSLEKEE
eukprot:15033.XXX_579779_581141_1 [CDS] Oithona nana genome sequencing.